MSRNASHLICLRCGELWAFPHECDIISGEVLVKIVYDDEDEDVNRWEGEGGAVTDHLD
jgi:hypothetical protein